MFPAIPGFSPPPPPPWVQQIQTLVNTVASGALTPEQIPGFVGAWQTVTGAPGVQGALNGPIGRTPITVPGVGAVPLHRAIHDVGNALVPWEGSIHGVPFRSPGTNPLTGQPYPNDLVGFGRDNLIVRTTAWITENPPPQNTGPRVPRPTGPGTVLPSVGFIVPFLPDFIAAWNVGHGIWELNPDFRDPYHASTPDAQWTDGGPVYSPLLSRPEHPYRPVRRPRQLPDWSGDLDSGPPQTTPPAWERPRLPLAPVVETFGPPAPGPGPVLGLGPADPVLPPPVNVPCLVPGAFPDLSFTTSNGFNGTASYDAGYFIPGYVLTGGYVLTCSSGTWTLIATSSSGPGSWVARSGSSAPFNITFNGVNDGFFGAPVVTIAFTKPDGS